MTDVIDWLLEGDPAIRWQVLRDLTDADGDEVATERARIAAEGWGARLLAEQGADGRWDGGVYRPGWVDESRPMFDAWTATHFSLQQLVDYGVDPASAPMRRAVARVREHVRWEHDDEPYFDGETEPCINGVALVIAAYVGEDGRALSRTLLDTRVRDGGWNCWDADGSSPSSVHATMCAVEGLLAYERVTGDVEVREARLGAEERLLERRLLWRLSSEALIDPRFAMISYPVRWYYDVLRALEHFRLAERRDDRLADAVAMLRASQGVDGRFRYENRHEGPVLFEMDGEREGAPSRWATLRALRVLRWWDAG